MCQVPDLVCVPVSRERRHCARAQFHPLSVASVHTSGLCQLAGPSMCATTFHHASADIS